MKEKHVKNISNTWILKEIIKNYIWKSNAFKKAYPLICIMILFSMIVELMGLDKLGKMISPDKENHQIIKNILFVFFFAVSSITLENVAAIMILNIATKIEVESLIDQLTLLMYDKTNFFDIYDPSKYLTNFNRTSFAVSNIVYFLIFKLFSLIITLICSSIFFIYTYKLKGGILFIFLIVTYIYIVIKMANIAMKYNHKKNLIENKNNSILVDLIKNKKLITQSDKETDEIKNFESYTENRRKKNLSFLKIRPITEIITTMIFYVFYFLILVIFLYDSSNNTSKVGLIGTLVLLMDKIKRKLSGVVLIYKEISKNISDIKTGGVIKNTYYNKNQITYIENIKKSKIDIPKCFESIKIKLISNISINNTNNDKNYLVSMNFYNKYQYNKIKHLNIYEIENIKENLNGIFISINFVLKEEYNEDKYINQNTNQILIKNKIECYAEHKIKEIFKLKKIYFVYKLNNPIEITNNKNIMITSKKESSINEFFTLLYTMLPQNVDFALDNKTHRYCNLYKKKISYIDSTVSTKFWMSKTILENINYNNLYNNSNITMNVINEININIIDEKNYTKNYNINYNKIKNILIKLERKELADNLNIPIYKLNLSENDYKIISVLRFLDKKADVFLFNNVFNCKSSNNTAIKVLLVLLEELKDKIFIFNQRYINKLSNISNKLPNISNKSYNISNEINIEEINIEEIELL